jgi:hypothetical protein
MGGFGEFDLVFVNQYAFTSESDVLPTVTKCDLTAKGGALRFGGGGVFPLASWLQLTPFAMATLGRFSKIDNAGTCPANLKIPDIPSGDVRTHAMIVLGVGGDIVLGRNR